MNKSLSPAHLSSSLFASLFAIVLASTLSPSHVSAQEQEPRDGVHVGKMSMLRKLGNAGGNLDQQAAAQYTQTMSEAKQKRALAPENHPQLIRLRSIAKKLIPFALPWNERASQWQWEVNLLASNQINAYCMPGGKIAFYTDILDSLKLTDDEVAIIMGHEIAHALREHGAERAGKSMFSNLAVRGLTLFAESKGVNGQLAAGVGNFGANLVMLSFSRDDETEADIVGLDIAARAGYDPRAGVVLWQKMGFVNKKAPPKWLSTHPAGKDRINEIRKHFPEVLPLYARTKGVAPSNLPAYKSNVKVIADVVN